MDVSKSIRFFYQDQNNWSSPLVVKENLPEVGETVFLYFDFTDDDGDGYGYLVEVLSVERNWNDTCWIVSHPGP